jgi:hypothetical protein
MGAEPGDGEQGTAGAGPGGGAPAESAAATSAETERMVGQIVDDGLAATGYAPGAAGTTPSAAAAAGAESDATARAVFVMRTLDDIAAPVPIGFDPAASPPPPDVSTTEDGLLDFQGVDLDADNARLARPAPGSSFPVRHRYNEAQIGVGIVALAAFVGAILFVSGSTGSPAASPAASGAAVVAGPTAESTPLLAPTAVPSDASTPDPTPDATPAPAASTPVAQSVTLRGPIDVRAMEKVGLEVGAHEVELLVFQDNGEVTGTFTIALETFPIGALLTGTFDEANNPKWAAFKKCTVRMTLEGTAKGTYDRGTGKLKGSARFSPVVEDLRDCLKTRPGNLTIDPTDVAKPTTVKWSATFDGKKAKGTLDLDPKLSFAATPAD